MNGKFYSEDLGEHVLVLSDEEMRATTAAFLERLRNAASVSGCNDLFEDEFPKVLCERYRGDTTLLTAWEHGLKKRGLL